MSDTNTGHAILLIDDNAQHLEELYRALELALAGAAAIVRWSPAPDDHPMEVFNRLIDEHPIRLVITDYDLTSQGKLGLFGATVVDWCQLHALPVGDFSRNHISSLAREPNLFELRIPIDTPQIAATFIAHVFDGFVQVRTAVDEKASLMTHRSPAAALADLLNAPHLITQFSQYGVRYGGANASLVDVFQKRVPMSDDGLEDERKRTERQKKVLAYIMGHLLINGVMRFPGPLVNAGALAAFLAVSSEEVAQIGQLFAATRYDGPFGELESYWWTDRVEQLLEGYRHQLANDAAFGSPGAERRALLELALNRAMTRDTACPRCQGKEGGFQCPYTYRAVCQRGDCSVVSNIWIPPGARLARFEREFYDEWAPILGM